MTGELALSVLQDADDARGYVAGFAVTDQRIVALGGTSNRGPMVVVSSDARYFEPRATPRGLGLRDALAVGDSLWVCGEDGQLAVSRDHGGRWQVLETGTEGCLFALALGSDGAIWVVGEAGYAARVLGEAVRRIDLGTAVRLASVHAVRDELVMLGGDGMVRRWRDGEVSASACGATQPLTGLAITGKGTWIVVGEGGFVARSPDGTWYSRVDAGVGGNFEAIGLLADGTIAIAGDRGQLLVSVDDARTWRNVEHALGGVHLWSIERFGRGLLIGGDGGLIARLAPPDDVTWSDRGTAAPPVALAAVLAAGPDGASVAVSDEPGAHEIAAHAADDRAGYDAELARTPPTAWSDLAWRWIDDGVAHRALLARLDQTSGAHRIQIVALDALRDANDDDRPGDVLRIAEVLSPELEAVLVGSLVRDDQLDGVLIVRDGGNADESGETGETGESDETDETDESDETDETDETDESDETDEGEDDEGEAPDPARVAAALAMTARGLRLAPHDADLQFTHAMLLLDAERAGDPSRVTELLALFAKLVPTVRINIAVRMGKAGHARFAEAVERVVTEALPARGFAARSGRAGAGAPIASFDDVAQELIAALADAVLTHTPEQLGALVPLLPDDAILLSELAGKALDVGHREAAFALYDRVVALAIPDDSGERTNYLRALNNACVQAHAAGAFEVAVRIADRAQPMAAQNPHIYHAAACAYVAVGDQAKALEQVKLAIEHRYEHVAKIEIDPDLGALLERPELKALFRDWHARREGN